MTNVLQPPDENILANTRQIPRIGKEGATPRNTVPTLPEEEQAPPSPPVEASPAPSNSPPVLPEETEELVGATPPIVEGKPLQGGEQEGIPEGQQPLSSRPLPQSQQQVKHPEGLSDKDLLSNNGGLGQLGSRPESRFTWSPIETPMPNVAGLAAMQEATSTYNQGVANYNQNMQNTSAQNIIRTYQLLNPQPIVHAGVQEIDTIKLRDELNTNRENSLRVVRENRLGLQDAREDGTGGEVSTGTSATENAIAGNGLRSNTGKNKQDREDPNREQTGTQGGLLGWIRRGVDAAHDAVSWIGEGLSLDPSAGIGGKERRERITRQNEKLKERGATERGYESPEKDPYNISRVAPIQGSKQSKQFFSPADGKYGDFGDHPVVSPPLYVMNAAQGVVMGGILEVTDRIGLTKKPSHDQRNRVVQSLQGVDNSFSANRSDYAPLSTQQPENAPKWKKRAAFAGGVALDIITGGIADAGVEATVRTGTRVVTRTTTKRTAQELAEEAAEKTSREAAQRTGKEATEQGSKDTGGRIPNKPATHKDPIIPHRGENTRVSDPTVKVKPNEVQVRSPHRMPETRRTSNSNGWLNTTIKVKPIDPKTIQNPLEVTPIKLQDLPSGNRLSDRIDAKSLNNKPLTDADLTLIRRSNKDISAVARHTINPETGKPILNSYRTLSDAEIAHLNDKYGNLFDRYGKPIPDLDNSNLLDTPDGLHEIIKNTDELKEVKLESLSIKQIEALHNQLDEISKKLTRSIEKGEGDITSVIKQYEDLSSKLIKATSQNQVGLYDMYVRRGDLPKSTSVLSREGQIIGDELVQTDLALQVQRPVLDQLIDEVDKTKFHLDNTEVELNGLRTVGRGDIYNALTTKEVMGAEVPELRINEYTPKLLPSLDELPSRPAGVHKVLDDNPLWLHGSDSPIGIRERDILNGATPSEHGLAIYLTKDQDVADQAASALAQSNRPPRPDSQPTVPYRVTVTTDKLIAPLDLNAKPSATIKKIFNDAANSVGLPSKYADKVTTNSKLWDDFKIQYHEQIGQVPESVNREFQQKVLIGLQKAGYDSGHYVDASGKVHLVVYQPHKLGVNGSPITLDTPSINKQAEARAWLDEYTFKSNPSEVTHVNSVRSRMQHQTQSLHVQAEALATERAKQLELIENKIKLQDQLEKLSYENTEKMLRADVEAAPPLDVQKTLRDNNNPCL